MSVRGIRGATTIDEDCKDQLLAATERLLTALQKANDFAPDDLASVLFTVTKDIKSAFPAEAARRLGWDKVPLLCFQEIDIRGSLSLCVRVLIHFNTVKTQDEIKHIYLGKAKALRPDLLE